MLFIEPIIAKQESEGGILLPDMAQPNPTEGVVLGCGPGRFEFGRLWPLTVRIGDVVKFGKYAGTDVTIDGDDYKIMREEEIFGIIAEDSPLDELFLGNRSHNVLTAAGITTVNELCKMTPSQLMKLKGCGRSTVRDINFALADFGLRLAEDTK